VAPAATIVLLVVLLAIELRRDSVIILPMQVPPWFTQRGYTGDGLTQLLVDRANAIRMRARTAKRSRHVALSLSTSTGSDLPEPPDLRLASTNVPLASIVRYLRQLLGREPTVIRGELVGDSLGATLILAVAGDSGASIPVSPGDLSPALQQGAAYILKMTEPYVLASYYYSLGSADSSLALIRYCLSHDPREDDAWAYLLWSIMLTDRGQLQQAETKASLAIAADPRLVNGYYRLAQTLYHQGRADEALRVLTFAAKMVEPTYEPTQNYLGIVLLKLHRDAEAVEHFQKAIALDPTDPWPYSNWGKVLVERSQVDSGSRLLAEAVARLPNRSQEAQVRSDWGDLYVSHRLYDSAAAQFDQARVMDSAAGTVSSRPYVGLGIVAFYQDSIELGNRHFAKAAAIDPGTLPLLRWGQRLAARGMYDSAVAKYQLALARDSTKTAVRQALAEALAKRDSLRAGSLQSAGKD
jgi:tetratricopeptide (TPR) repeat protein